MRWNNLFLVMCVFIIGFLVAWGIFYVPKERIIPTPSTFVGELPPPSSVNSVLYNDPLSLKRFEKPEMHIAFYYPEGWFLKKYEPGDFQPLGDRGQVYILYKPIGLEGDDSGVYLDIKKDKESPKCVTELVTECIEFSINGFSGFKLEYKDDLERQNVPLYILSSAGSDRSSILVAFSMIGNYSEELKFILSSLEFIP